ncbi:MAG: NUDIX hydrolase [Ardenticatenaceae bacterium]|nr:NUDIX hydrolase [Anaerolineales bacterium]MCB8976391.1 NUDIX hydrolase [Ardenticatenaceae bacterium]
MTQQPLIVSQSGRPFATSAIALQAIIINDEAQFLLLCSPRRNEPNEWQVVSGGLEAGETILDGILREVREEVGPILVRPLAVLHSQTFHYDDNVRFMVGIYYLLRYEGGTVVPGDDMVGSAFRWWGLAELETAVAGHTITLHKSTHLWQLRRAARLCQLLADERVETAVLQPEL